VGRACGFYFPNLLLANDDALLAAPVAEFEAELMRLNLVKATFPSRLSTNSYAEETAQMDLADLELALGRQGVELGQAKDILRRYTEARAVVLEHAKHGQRLERAYAFVPPAIPAGLPAEFADYLEGAVAWHADKTNAARAAWTRLLNRPADQRLFRSTWAAFMLGRSFSEQDGAKAISCYQHVRSLAKAGFADTLGLAAASVGWEAQAEYYRDHHERAIELYLEQLAGGDSSAVLSLRWVANDALRKRARALRPLARHLPSRRVITAYVISGGFAGGPVDVDGPVREAAADLLSQASFVAAPAGGWHTLANPVVRWLEALEKVEAKDVESAERLALAAYQCGEFDLAQRWLARSGSQPMARWLQAKLRLREGRVREAAELLAGLAREFPVDASGTNGPATATTNLLQSVMVEQYSRGAASMLQGELGALRLARREYTEALEALLNGGFWPDAAYVAERVLTVEELKQFVDRGRGRGATVTKGTGQPSDETTGLSPGRRTVDENLRYLLARRLTRVSRGGEATDYYPETLQAKHRIYLHLLAEANAATGVDTGTAVNPVNPVKVRNAGNAGNAFQRAAALWTAALMTCNDGMELLGTELEPDWAISGGSFEHGNSVMGRAAYNGFARPSWNELDRGRAHDPSYPERFHYRYLAADLAWEAAKLMPNNSEETARVLCLAGSWLKNRDPIAADVFYKALVRRCRGTALGQAADRKRWFPAIQ
jgi:hypothetical protein